MASVPGARAPQLPALTGLRFLAALGVVLVHFGLHLVPAGPLHTLAAHGDLGVSLFFILSGFILAYNYLDARGLRTSRLDFWVARIARIYPVYLLSLLVALGPALWERQLTAGAALTTPLLVQSWHDAWATAWNGPAWSLSAEAFFYACFPAIGGLVARLPSARVLAVVAGGWCASLALIVACARLDVAYETAVYHPLFRLPEFLCGVGAGVLVTRGRGLLRAGPWSLCACALLAVALLTLDGRLPHMVFNEGLLTPILCLLIYALASDAGPLGAVLQTRPLVALGEASYALYLLHVPIWHWLAHLEGGSIDPQGYPLSYSLVYLVLAIASSLAAYRFLEMPARRAIRSRYARSFIVHEHIAASPRVA